MISISYRTISAIEQVCEKTRAGRILDPGDLIVDLADAITARLDPEVAVLGDLIDDLEGHIGERAVAGARSRIAGVRSRSIDFRRFLQPQRDALERLSLTTAEWVTEEDRLHLREDNADLRLTEKGFELGVVPQERFDAMRAKRDAVERETARLKSSNRS